MAEQPAPEDQAGEDQAGKGRQESIWASFTRDDMKLLLITFAGTVAANVVTVMVVALAVIAARPTKGLRLTVSIVLIFVTYVVVGILCAAISAIATRRMRARGVTSRVIRVMIAGVVAMGLFALVYLLVLLGLAAGVK
jgi:hypothetical protein